MTLIHSQRQKGFTLIEVLLVIALISLLSTFGYASYSQVQNQSRDARRKADLGQIRSTLELYYNANSSYPTTLSFGSAVWQDSNGVYMKPVPQDPKFGVGVAGYCYNPVGTPPTSFTLYASLENTSDKDVKPAQVCAGTSYNYYVTSPF